MRVSKQEIINELSPKARSIAKEIERQMTIIPYKVAIWGVDINGKSWRKR